MATSKSNIVTVTLDDIHFQTIETIGKKLNITRSDTMRLLISQMGYMDDEDLQDLHATYQNELCNYARTGQGPKKYKKKVS